MNTYEKCVSHHEIQFYEDFKKCLIKCKPTTDVQKHNECINMGSIKCGFELHEKLLTVKELCKKLDAELLK